MASVRSVASFKIARATSVTNQAASNAKRVTTLMKEYASLVPRLSQDALVANLQTRVPSASVIISSLIRASVSVEKREKTSLLIRKQVHAFVKKDIT